MLINQESSDGSRRKDDGNKKDFFVYNATLDMLSADWLQVIWFSAMFVER
jgi:hypothetical protein